MELSRRSRRAIMLISVLLMTVLTLMFVGAAVALAPSGVTRTQADLAMAAARRAAQSGVDWARVRISQDPRWNATTSATFSDTGLFVREADGQVVGWTQDAQGWSRFRIRFNYQDGPGSATSNSDEIDDPTTAWSDFPYCSCNNLLGGADKLVPLAQSGSSYQSSGAWGNTQLTVPGGRLLISVEGAHGGSVAVSGGQPSQFTGGFRKSVVQTVLKLGTNQPITEAAIMAAGDLALDALNSPVQLNATGPEAARVRTRGQLTVNGGVNSSNGELRYGTGQAVSGPVSPGVSISADDTSGFFKIPFDKVRAPVSPATIQAGVYVVTSTGQVEYHNMNYADFVTASPAPSGTPTALPSGMALTGPHPSPSPKYAIVLTKDVQVNPSGSVTDFALIPDGGAPQSANYGGVASATPAPPPPASTTAYVNLWFGPISTKPPLTDTGYSTWLNFANSTMSYQGTVSGSTVHSLNSNATSAVNYRQYSQPFGGTFYLPVVPPSSAPTTIYPWTSSNSGMRQTLDSSPSYLSSLQTEFPLSGSPSPSPSGSPSASPTPTGLAPKDLELRMQGGSSGLTLANSGKITIGAQVDGNGSSIVSESDIALIGTSTDLSSNPGSQLGLNLYSKGTITIDTYKLDSSGATFGSVNLKGIMYSWFGINVLAGSDTESAPFTMRGSMVAYGGDPAGNPTPGMAQAAIKASSIDITYDPSYVANLVSGGPFTLDVLSWHEF